MCWRFRFGFVCFVFFFKQKTAYELRISDWSSDVCSSDLGPITTVQIGMGDNILILALVVIVIGGIGSIRGAFIAAVAIGVIDTMGRAFLDRKSTRLNSSH